MKKIIVTISIAISLCTQSLLSYEFDFLNTTNSVQTVEWSLSGCSTAGAVELFVPKGLGASALIGGGVAGGGGAIGMASGAGFGVEVGLGVAGVGAAATVGLTAAAAANNAYMPKGCSGSIDLNPGEWSTVKASGKFAGYCIDTVKAGGKTWKGSKCHNQGFTIDDSGIHTHGKVYVYNFRIVNQSHVPVNVNAKVLVLNQGFNEIKTTLQPQPAKLKPLPPSATKEQVQQHVQSSRQATTSITGANNVIRIAKIGLKGPNDTTYSMYMGDKVLSGDFTLIIKFDTTKNLLYFIDGNGKTYYPIYMPKIQHGRN